jgi:hypothetical protein
MSNFFTASSQRPRLMTRLDECDDLRAEFGAIYLAAANLKATMAKVTIILEAL